MQAYLDVCSDAKLSIGYVYEVAGAEMAGADRAWVWIQGSGTSLGYLSPRISAKRDVQAHKQEIWDKSGTCPRQVQLR